MWWLVLIVFAFLIPEILSTILESRIGRAVAAQIENRGRTGSVDGLHDRVRYLETEVDRLSRDVQRLSEETEFFQRLLTERAPEGGTEHTPGDRAP